MKTFVEARHGYVERKAEGDRLREAQEDCRVKGFGRSKSGKKKLILSRLITTYQVLLSKEMDKWNKISFFFSRSAKVVKISFSESQRTRATHVHQPRVHFTVCDVAKLLADGIPSRDLTCAVRAQQIITYNSFPRPAYETRHSRHTRVK